MILLVREPKEYTAAGHGGKGYEVHSFYTADYGVAPESGWPPRPERARSAYEMTSRRFAQRP